jgi:hypothetical protein
MLFQGQKIGVKGRIRKRKRKNPEMITAIIIPGLYKLQWVVRG